MNLIRTRLIALAWVSLTPAAWAAPQAGDPPKESIVLQNAAANMQRAGKFELAADTWADLIERFPDTKVTNLWRYNFGICQHQRGEHEQAAAAFEAVLQKPPADFAFEQECRLFLGFNQWKLSRAASETGDPAAAAERARQAAAALAALLEKFPAGTYRDQALYFLGESQMAAGDFDQASASFERVIAEFPESNYRADALFALGTAREERGEFRQAIADYDRFLQQFADHDSATAVRFRKAESLLRASDQAEPGADAAADLAAAELLYAEVAGIEGFSDAGLAAYQRGVCLARLQKPAEAGEVFAAYATKYPEGELAPTAATLAGRSFVKAGDAARAEAWLAQARQRHPTSPDLAHALCQALIALRRPGDVFPIAEEMLRGAAGKAEAEAPLWLDLGDAAFAIPERLPESIGWYLKIVDQYPAHELAPHALYNAAYSQLIARQADAALALADRFDQQYGGHAFAADVGEVRAEALLQKQQYAEAEAVFRKLLAAYPQHAKLPSWKLGLAQALSRGVNPTDAAAMIASLAGELSGREKAEALYHLAVTQFQGELFAEAVASLEQSLAADSQWPRFDEVLLLAARAEARLKHTDQARAYAERGLKDWPGSAIRDQFIFRLGELEFDAANFEAAGTRYQQLVEELPDSPLVPAALYGLGWSQLQRSDFEAAIRSFDRLTDEFPQHDHAADALIARGVARRKQGDLRAAIADFNAYLATGPQTVDQTQATYERGLAEAELEDWEAAVNTFQQLLTIDPQSPSTDKYLYELAWAHRQRQEHDLAAAHFQRLANEFPQSSFAAEAHFHLGEGAFEKDDFATAAEHYTAAQKTVALKDLAEKIAYKLAFAHYQQEQYDASEAGFRQQVADYPDGPLAADGAFMTAESLFRQKKYTDALAAYLAALPKIEAEGATVDAAVKRLARLHGAQSANEAKEYAQAAALVQPIIERSDDGPPAEAWFEYGQALRGQGQLDAAAEAWAHAAPSPDKTGVRAACMIGEVLFEKKQFDDAIQQFSLAVYGYGGEEAAADVRPWQAFAAYEAGRCYAARISQADAANRAKFIQESKSWFEYLVEHYADDRLAEEAKKQLEKLNQL